MYDRLSLEIQAFLPHVQQPELEATDLDELCQLAAEARVVQSIWRDLIISAVGKALGGNK